MSKLTEVWGGSKAQIADKVRIYSDKTNKIPSFVMLTLLHEAMKEIDELENGVSMDILGSFHEWVNRRMDEKGFTQQNLADKAHISLATVNHLIHGKTDVYLSTAVKVLEALL